VVENRGCFKLFDPRKIKEGMGEMSKSMQFYEFGRGPNLLCTFDGAPLGSLGDERGAEFASSGIWQ